MVKRRPVEILRSALCHVAQRVSLRALEPSPGTDLPQMVPAIFPMISGLRACPRAARGPAWHSGCDLSRDGSWRWAADGYRGGWVGHGVAGVAQEPVGNEHSSWGDGWGSWEDAQEGHWQEPKLPAKVTLCPATPAFCPQGALKPWPANSSS